MSRPDTTRFLKREPGEQWHRPEKLRAIREARRKKAEEGKRKREEEIRRMREEERRREQEEYQESLKFGGKP